MTAINTANLVSAAMLQDFIIGKNAAPLAAGVISLYSDSNFTVPKNWYYQTNVTAPYTFAALPNPMTLSAAGTIVDVSGNDVIPFYYPFIDPIPPGVDPNTPQLYFIKVEDANGQLQFTRNGFPYSPTNTTPVATEIPTLSNYIVNNRFWRNFNGSTGTGGISAGSLSNTWTKQYNSTGTYYYQTLCPDQHDGFSMPDLNYVKNVNGSCTETITFNTFAKQSSPQLTGDIQPEFYINHNCSVDSSGAALKVYQFPISLHLATLSCQPFSFTIQGRVNSGSATIGIYIYTFCGTGVASPDPELIDTIILSSNWSKTTLSYTFPPTTGLTLGSDGAGGNDDAYYLQIMMPCGTLGVNPICNIDFTLPSIYLSEPSKVPTNSFATYDEIDRVIASPRTGDIRTGYSTFYPFGWAPLNGGTLVKPGTVTPPTSWPITYQGADGWALYNLIWNNYAHLSVASTSLVQAFDSSGTPIAIGSLGSSAYADWNAHVQLQLASMLGLVITGAVPMSAMTGVKAYQSTFTLVAGNVVTTNAMSLYTGQPVIITVSAGGSAPTGLALNTVFYVTNIVDSQHFGLATSFSNAQAGTAISISGGSGTFTITMYPTYGFSGEFGHTQLLTELISHHHAYTAPSNYTASYGAGGQVAANSSTTANTSDTGGSLPFNITQPAYSFNMYIKL